MINLFDKKTWRIILFIFLAELFSIFAFLLPDFEKVAFFIIAALVLILSLIKIEYGIFILLAELFIGSKGYLFYFENGGTVISIRIALWLIVMAVWLGKFLVSWARNKQLLRLELNKKNIYFYYFTCLRRQVISRQRRISPWLIFLFIFITWGLINGFINHNSFPNIFFDFNGWLYFALIFPIYDLIKNKENIYNLGRVFLAAMIWLSLKTFFFLFAFSHNFSGVVSELYKWVRATGVGEITPVQGGFYRIFFQSHIFILIGFFILLTFFSNQLFKDKKILTSYFTFYFLLLTSSLSVILISFSRSFWVGLAAGLLFYYFSPLAGIISRQRRVSLWRALFYKWRMVIKMAAVLLMAGAVAVGLILIIVKFPYPQPLGGFDTASLFSERISKTDEAAIFSRWQLLPPLWTAIKRNPVLGSGFGATVTYYSKDPRVLESTPAGEYTTYAFEWGWLDIWLKLGLLGLLTYLILIGKIVYSGFGLKNNLASSLAIGLIVVAVVSFFSPYTNHPLGIGYLIIAAAAIERLKAGTSLA